ncbi:hypothetical protein C2S53_007418 [Perilla frutescens var. hirtella]|uniref:Uncharacterized protein n=1 Tax=Perilla frutescens var. hirtella TaxID=608512 RepID=A0AAD4JFU8_PERFH|nr:hypothetical protein C2S53_007418 [Perilla frutescens var. hirtella]
MAFMVSENEASLSINEAHSKDGSEPPLGSVSSQLFLKSSSHRSLDKDVVLRRLRHHKTVSRLKSAFHAIMAAPPPHDDYDEKWLQRGDTFTSP